MSLLATLLSYFMPFDAITVFILFSGQKTSPPPEKREEFTCPSGYGNGNYADPVTCRRFYQVCSFEFLFVRPKFSIAK